jgi:asparagine synthase (glutamine-hydrolysing)
MAAFLRSRGPDDVGLVDGGWFAAGFRRLSIFARSSGRQPVSSPSGEITLVFNGELYEYAEIARDLASRGAAVCSEAQALLALYALHGADFARDLDGDYAIVVFDARSGTCHLLRDPFGVKPLYYAPLGGAGGWAIASDPAALFIHRDFSTDWDFTALAERQVLGFCLGSDQFRGDPPGPAGRPRHDQAGDPRGARVSAADQEHLAATRALDVGRLDTGALVSSDAGGAAPDRSPRRRAGRPRAFGQHRLVAPRRACRRALAGGPHAVTIGVEGGDDERAASAVARSLGLRHRFDAITADALAASLPRLVLTLGSQGPSYSAYFLGAAARRLSPDAKVLLVGEGADELFFGYQIHRTRCRTRAPR